MPRGDTQPRNHPRKGSSIKVEPIRDIQEIRDIQDYLYCEGRRRDYCLFIVGINTAYRASDLLSLTIGQVAHLKPGDIIDIKEKKTGKYRPVTMNHAVWGAIDDWLRHHPDKDNPDAPLFPSFRRKAPLTVPTLNRMVKGWCQAMGVHGHFGSHTLRKTWGYHQRTVNAAPLPLLMSAFGHSSEAQTLRYLFIQDREIRDLYMGLDL